MRARGKRERAVRQGAPRAGPSTGTILWIWALVSWFDQRVTTGSETIQNAPAGSGLDPSEALRHERRVSAALREVGVALGTTFDLDDLLELILSKLTELVEADRATLYLLDEAKKELVSRLVVGDKVRSVRMKLGHGIPGMVAQTGKSIDRKSVV